jgi:molybdopterin synthase sulfur carrier subunit
VSVKLVYFAWVRERIGMAEETVDLPEDITTGAELVAWLSARGDNYAHALAEPLAIRIAIDQELIEPHDAIGDAGEIALFPPMTGG